MPSDENTNSSVSNTSQNTTDIARPMEEEEEISYGPISISKLEVC